MTRYTYYAHPRGAHGGPDHAFSDHEGLLEWARLNDITSVNEEWLLWRVKDYGDYTAADDSGDSERQSNVEVQ